MLLWIFPFVENITEQSIKKNNFFLNQRFIYIHESQGLAWKFKTHRHFRKKEIKSCSFGLQNLFLLLLVMHN